jgi:hypothetical protein
MAEIGMETDELALIFADFFDGESVARASDYLLIVKTFNLVMGGLED